MDLNEFLENNPLINKAELARRMFSNSKQPTVILNQKLKGYTAGNGKQRITEKDFSKAKEVLKNLSDDINKL